MNYADRLLFKAIRNLDRAGVARAIKIGADVNFAATDTDETPLVLAIIDSCVEDCTHVQCMEICTPALKAGQAIVRLLLENGADPNFRGIANCGVMFEAVLLKDVDILMQLLQAGGDPNFLLDAYESLYDLAEFDYRHDVMGLNLPLESADADRCSESAWLDFLERCADHAGKMRPEHLRVLRSFGAKTTEELRQSGNWDQLLQDHSDSRRPREV